MAKTGSKPVTLLEILGIDGCIQSICGSAKERAAPSSDKHTAGSSTTSPVLPRKCFGAPGPKGAPEIKTGDEEPLCVGDDIWTPLGGWSAGPHTPATAAPTEAALALAAVKELAKQSCARWAAADNAPAGSNEVDCLEMLAEYWHHAEAFVPDDEEKRWAGLGAEVEAQERRRKARVAQWQAETGLRIAESGGRVGLSNLRNTCWMNSVLQILAHLGPFMALMLAMADEEHTSEPSKPASSTKMGNHNSSIPDLQSAGGTRTNEDTRGSGQIHRRATFTDGVKPQSDKVVIIWRVRELLQTLWQDHNSSAVNPSRIHVALMRLAPWFIRKGMREDALEFFAFLLQQLHEELEDKSRPATKDGEEMPEMIDLRAWVTCLSSVRSPIHSLFQGRQLSTVTCMQCGHFSQRPEDFLHISIPMKSATLDALAKPAAADLHVPANVRRKDRSRSNYFGVIQLQDALASVTAEELLTGDNCWECERCKKKVEATKKLKLDQMPPVLLIHLLRFTYDPSADAVVKMRGQVELPENWWEVGIDLSRHCTKADHTCLYDVLGVVNHHGPDTGNGHYTACCRHDVDGSWYLFNDNQVETVDPSGAYLPECAYVICLVRRHCKAPVIRSNPQGDMRSWASSGFESFCESDTESTDDAEDTGGPSATENDEAEARAEVVVSQDEDSDAKPYATLRGLEVNEDTSDFETNTSIELEASTCRPPITEAIRPPPGARKMEDPGRAPPPGARRTERS